MKIKPMHLGKTLESPWIFFLLSSLSLFLSLQNLEISLFSLYLAELDTHKWARYGLDLLFYLILLQNSNYAHAY